MKYIGFVFVRFGIKKIYVDSNLQKKHKMKL